MTYARLEHIERIAGRLEAEKIASRFTAVQRQKIVRLCAERERKERAKGKA